MIPNQAWSEVPQANDWFSPGGNVASVIPGEAEERLLPIFIPDDLTINAIGVEIVSAGTAGAVCRLGIRGFDPVSRRPSGLFLDAGTVDGTVVNANGTTISINVKLPRGIAYASCTVQGGAATRPTIRGLTQQSWHAVKPDMINTVSVCWLATGVSGALPSAFSGTRQSATPVRLWLRAA